MSTTVPVLSVFKKSITKPLEHIPGLLKISIPLIIFIVFDNLLEPTIESSIILKIISFVIFIALSIVAIIACHRMFLLDEKIESFKIFKWTKSEFKYLKTSIIVIIAMIIFNLILGIFVAPFIAGFMFFEIDQSVLVLLLNLPSLYIISRWSIIFPNIALGNNENDLGWAWRQTEGEGWRLTILISIIPFVFELILSLIPFSDSGIFGIVSDLLWLVVATISISLISFSYDHLKENGMY